MTLALSWQAIIAIFCPAIKNSLLSNETGLFFVISSSLPFLSHSNNNNKLRTWQMHLRSKQKQVWQKNLNSFFSFFLDRDLST